MPAAPVIPGVSVTPHLEGGCPDRLASPGEDGSPPIPQLDDAPARAAVWEAEHLSSRLLGLRGASHDRGLLLHANSGITQHMALKSGKTVRQYGISRINSTFMLSALLESLCGQYSEVSNVSSWSKSQEPMK